VALSHGIWPEGGEGVAVAMVLSDGMWP